ncbi:hypothetical protein ACFXHA_40245 [Nocardia sp. NPDC059240]|uniref:hypothetical protein n=1 Tax=Nocardia sp. NPDC059240 TaxID=3346786 RepID=UPI003677515D
MKRIILVGAAACALFGINAGTAAAQGIPLTASDVDTPSSGSAESLGNALGVGTVYGAGAGALLGSAAAGLGAQFAGGYLNGVLSTLSAH